MFLLVSYKNYGQSSMYKYDKVNRLIESRVGCSLKEYSYDENGNRKQSKTSHINVDAAITDISCSGNDSDGKIELSAPDNANHTYVWNTGQKTSTINNLSAGVFVVTITDVQRNFSCVRTFKVLPPQIKDSFKITTNNISCFGYKDSKAKVIVVKSSPSAVYHYNWNTTSNSTFTSTDSINSIDTGNYIVSIKNLTNGCLQSIPFDISSPEKSILGFTKYDNRCAGGKTGNITLAMRGDPLTYAYNWKAQIPPFTETTQNIFSLLSGTYHITVKENFGNHCAINDSVKITDIRSREILDLKTTRPDCVNPMGKAEASMLDLVHNYSYEWLDKSNNRNVGPNSNIASLNPGKYFLIAKENISSGCTDTMEFSIQESLENKLIAYPNPTTGIVTIESCNNSNTSIIYIVFDETGRMLDRGEFLSLPAQVSFIKYPKGGYVLSLFDQQTNTRPFKSLRIIKQ